MSGLKVLELGSMIAGPFGARILADFGADVIKVELPNGGDPLRTWRALDPQGTSFWWYVQSRNKRCITLDCREPDDLQVLKRLLREADVLLENFKPGTLAEWGLTAEALNGINPRLIVCHISGFGQDGPYHNRAGFGAIGEAMGGLRHLTGYPDRPPVRVGISLGDSLAGLYGVIGILMALYHRDVKGGSGQEVDVALYEVVFSLMESALIEYDRKGTIRQRTGSVLPGIAPSNAYPTRDGKSVVIGANSDAIVRRLLVLMERTDLLGDPQWATSEARASHMESIDADIGRWSAGLTLDECVERLNASGVPAGPIYDIADIANDPQYLAREMILEIDDARAGRVKVPGIVPKLSTTPGKVQWLGPGLGEHNDQVMRELGLAESERKK